MFHLFNYFFINKQNTQSMDVLFINIFFLNIDKLLLKINDNKIAEFMIASLRESILVLFIQTVMF